jgi:mercuric reductase
MSNNGFDMLILGSGSAAFATAIITSSLGATVVVAEVPKAAAIFDTRGLVKMVIDEDSGKILGVHLAANRGSDIIHEAVLAVKFGLTVDNLIDTIHVYPTMSEALRMVAQSFTRDVSKLSCCAE